MGDHCESSPGSFDECRLSAGWPPVLKPSQPTWAVSLPVGCYYPHPPSPFIIVAQPESWYSFYHLMDSGRLSRPRHYSKGVYPVPKAVHCSVYRDKHNCPQWDSNLGPLTLLLCTLPLDRCNLQRHVGVNNLPKVVTRQRGIWELNLWPLNHESNALTIRLPSQPSRAIKQLLLWLLLKRHWSIDLRKVSKCICIAHKNKSHNAPWFPMP